MPAYTKGDLHDKKNYRPINIFPALCKVFEGVTTDELRPFLETAYSPHLSGFRKNHSWQDVLLRFVEKCRWSIDNNYIYGAISTDMSKVFDCLPHRVMVSKLNAYGLHERACLLIACIVNYVRKQRVEMGVERNEWLPLLKGTPQGSISGPYVFNVFQNDLMYMVSNICDVCNYADDNTVGCLLNHVQQLITKLQKSIGERLKVWVKLYARQSQ